ncbi:uncharacterized protein LOC122197082 [Lactuca sativa]|uniref:uncharacterized protein LOC122197082 n=1 Tax=Lactuca sativa TaxID=4236 RepID=UPI001C68D605|nr:uncharacterized protein LOC122197082 [Lactuca sativa]
MLYLLKVIAFYRHLPRPLITIVGKQLPVPEDYVVTGESKFASLGVDYPDIVEIVMGLEEEFGISVEEESAQTIATVHDVDLIDKIIKNKSPICLVLVHFYSSFTSINSFAFTGVVNSLQYQYEVRNTWISDSGASGTIDDFEGASGASDKSTRVSSTGGYRR